MTPDAYTHSEFQLPVGDGHELYVQDWGNPDATMPVIQLHGGPGGSSSDRKKGDYDPAKQRVIFFDQRGCGRSTQYGSREHNTTQDLIADITKIADKLGLSKFVLRGGSWGSCLALAYTIAEPGRVAGLVLDGVFTGSRSEIDWLDQGQFKTFYPDAWERYIAVTPEEFQDEPTAYHSRQALAGNRESALAYETLEGAIVFLDDRQIPEKLEDFDEQGITTELHYMVNGCFMADRYILDHAHTIAVPVIIVQGRYDMVCPPATAYELHKAVQGSRLFWTQNGHVPEHEAQNLIKLQLELLTA